MEVVIAAIYAWNNYSIKGQYLCQDNILVSF